MIRKSNLLLVLFGCGMFLSFAGCEEERPLMPTPNLYARQSADPFADVPPALQSSGVDVLYLTDRKREGDSTAENAKYGYERSRSVAYGVSHVEIGKDLAWDQLVKESRTSDRSKNLTIRVTKTTELGQFPPTPRRLVEIPNSTENEQSQFDVQVKNAEQTLSSYLAKSPSKDVYVFVHGYSNTFYDAVMTIGQIWHFLGRQGVAVAYTWPAGRGGLLRGYTYDRESSEFTVFHLKQMLRYIAANPDVGKIHILAHSRGTDVAVSALRELHLEISGSGRSTREVLKLGTVILAAPDVDFDVFVQRAATARLGLVPERSALYICADDEALGLANWLFGGHTRLGKITSELFKKEELEALRKSRRLQIIDARVSDPGPFGHGYFYNNPAVSSDLILLLRYHLQPGAEFGRPLQITGNGFWTVDDHYPKSVGVPATMPALTEAGDDK